MLVNWEAYLKQVERIRNLTTSGATSQRKGIAIRGREQLSPLDHSKFFVTYPKLLEKREEIDMEINYLIHNTKKYMQRALTAYFGSRFNGQVVELVEKPKKADGVQVNSSSPKYSNVLSFLAWIFRFCKGRKR